MQTPRLQPSRKALEISNQAEPASVPPGLIGEVAAALAGTREAAAVVVTVGEVVEAVRI